MSIDWKGYIRNASPDQLIYLIRFTKDPGVFELIIDRVKQMWEEDKVYWNSFYSPRDVLIELRDWIERNGIGVPQWMREFLE